MSIEIRVQMAKTVCNLSLHALIKTDFNKSLNFVVCSVCEPRRKEIFIGVFTASR